VTIYIFLFFNVKAVMSI